MSMAVISLDTVNKQCTLTLDGALIQADCISFYKGTDYNGDPVLVFKYEIEVADNNGLNQSIEYELPQPDMNMQGRKMEKTGMASRIVEKFENLINDVKNFMKK